MLDALIRQSGEKAKPELYLQKSVWLRALKKYAEADALAAKCLEMEPKPGVRAQAALLGVRAGCRLDREDWAGAYEMYCRIDPKEQGPYLLETASAAMALGKYREAEALLERVVKRGTAERRMYGAALNHLKKLNAGRNQ